MAIRKSFNLKSIKLDIPAWERQLKKEMEEEIKVAAQDWLATVIAIVPVWSRASHATFKPLADAVGFTIPTQPLVAKKDRSSLGESVSQGRVEITKDTFHFVYETDLRYLAANEMSHVEFPEAGIFSPKGLRTPTPFNFTGQAAEQFRARTTELPNPFRFIRTRNL
jgi:hypothetical protein